jgi:hypothetical protein
MKMMSFVLIAFGGLTAIAHADTHWYGFTHLSPEGLPNDMKWSYQEGHNFDEGCKNVNASFRTKVTCTFDRAGFEKFYAAEMHHPKEEDRMNESPDNICGQHAMDFLIGDTRSTGFGDKCSKDEECRKDFVGKVKSITCVIIPSESPSSMTLKDGVLKMVLTRPASGDWMPGNGWMQESALKLFPRYKQLSSH